METEVRTASPGGGERLAAPMRETSAGGLVMLCFLTWVPVIL